MAVGRECVHGPIRRRPLPRKRSSPEFEVQPPIRKVNGKSVVAVDGVQPGWRGGLEDQEERVVVGGLKNGIFIPLMNTLERSIPLMNTLEISIPLMNTLEIFSSLWACRTTKSDPKCGPRRSRMRSLIPDPSARETDGGILVGGWRLLRLRWTFRRRTSLKIPRHSRRRGCASREDSDAFRRRAKHRR